MSAFPAGLVSQPGGPLKVGAGSAEATRVRAGCLYPLSRREARTNAALLIGLGGLVLLPDALIGISRFVAGRTTLGEPVLAVGVALGLLLTALATRRGLLSDGFLGVPLAVCGLALAWGMNMITRDGSIGAQAALMLPLVYAAHDIRPRPAIGLIAVTMVAQVHTSLTFAVGDPFRDVAMLLMVEIGLAGFIMHAARRQHELQDVLRKLATIDPLTGLVTRAQLDAALQKAAGRDGACALLLFDMDAFKRINDTYGHLAGDTALSATADELRNATGPRDIASRIGGDEFALLLVDCDKASAHERAERIVTQVAGLRIELADGQQLCLSISAGVAHSEDVVDVARLYPAADQSLYEAKRAGRNRVAIRLPDPPVTRLPGVSDQGGHDIPAVEPAHASGSGARSATSRSRSGAPGSGS